MDYVYQTTSLLGQARVGLMRHPQLGPLFGPFGDESRQFTFSNKGVMVSWADSAASYLDEIITITREQLESA